MLSNANLVLSALLLLSGRTTALQPGENSTACLAPPTDCSSVCSTIPNPQNENPAANPLCYQSSPNNTNNDYNHDPANPVDSIPSCNTCAFYNYSFYVRNDPVYTNMELWSPVNPLCLLLDTTNIQDLVNLQKMEGWQCDENHQAIGSYCSGWTGVRCNNEGDQALAYPYNETVKELSLPGIGLEGRLPGSMDLLEFMTVLDLSHNSLSGSLPETLGSPTYLQTLKLNSNQLEGALPNAFMVLTSLVEFNVSDNHMRYVVPDEFGRLSSLQSLDLHTNAFEGSVPRELCDTQLNYLNFENNENILCYDDCLSSVATLVAGSVQKCSIVQNTGYKSELSDTGHGSSMLIGISGSGEFQYAATPKEAFDVINSSYPLKYSVDYGKDFSDALVDAATPWSSVAVANYGYAYATNGNGAYVTADDGATWTVSKQTDYAQLVVTSMDGSFAVLVEGEGAGVEHHGVYSNSNYGSTADWIKLTLPGWVDALSMSVDGAVIAALDRSQNNSLYVSTDWGAQWEEVLFADITCGAVEVAYKGDNMYLTDCVQRQGTESVNIEVILMSTDFGQTWFNSKAPVVSWKHIATNSDGGNVVWASSEDGLYYSSNYGKSGSFIRADASTGWDYVATISDGRTVMATRTGGGHDGVYVGSIGAGGSRRRSLRSDGMHPTDKFSNSQVLNRDNTQRPRLKASRALDISDDYLWTQTGAPAAYTGIAMSNTSTYMIGVAGGADPGIYVTNNGGFQWQQILAGGNYECVCSSGTGQYMYASVANSDGLPQYVTRSAEYGTEWLSSKGIPQNLSNPVVGLATSSSGQFVTAITSYEPIYFSSDYGETFTEAEGTPIDSFLGNMGSYFNGAVAVSGTGQIQVVASITAGVAISNNFGANWAAANVAGGGYSSAAISYDGQTIAVASPSGEGSIFISTDGGATFTAGSSLQGSDLDAVYVAMSADGSTIVAAVDPGGVYMSTNFADPWTEIFNSTDANWGALAASSSLDAILVAQSFGDASYQLSLGSNLAQSPPTSMPSAAVVTSGGDDDNDLSTGEIAGIAIGSVVGVVALGFAAFYFCCAQCRIGEEDSMKADLITGAELRKSQH